MIDNNAAWEISIQANEIKARLCSIFDRSLKGVEGFTVNETITIIISGGNRGITPRFERKARASLVQLTKCWKLEIFKPRLAPALALTVQSSE